MADPHSLTLALTDTFDANEHLDAARAALERADGSITLPPIAGALYKAGLTTSPVPTAKPAPSPTALATAARHELPFETPVALGLPIARAPAMRPTQVAGPFSGASGRFWIYLYGPARSIAIYAAGATQPTFVVTKARVPTVSSTPYVIELDGGSLWIRASMLGAGLPDDAFVGVTIATGKLTFAKALTGTGDRLEYTGAVDAGLEASLAPRSTTGHACATAATVSGPSSVRITWKPPAPVKIELGPASASLAGTSFTFDPYVGPPQRDSELDAILFPYTIAPVTWDSSTLSAGASAVSFTGTTRVDGGWGLSLVRPDASGHLAEADGPGFFALHCRDPIHVQWRDAPGAIDLGDARLIVRQGQLLLTSRHGSTAAFTQTFRSWAVRSEADAPRLPIRVTMGKAGAIVFVYYCDAALGDGFLTTCAADVALDRPVGLTGIPLSFATGGTAIFGIGRDPGGVDHLYLLAVSGAISTRQKGIALRNALLGVTDPAVVTLDGTLSSGGKLDRGTLRLTLGAGGWVPTLPDPYVSNHPIGRQERRPASATSVVLATITWTTPQTPALEFSGSLGIGQLIGQTSPMTPNPARPAVQSPSQIRVPTQTEQGSLLSFKSVPGTLLRAPVAAAVVPAVAPHAAISSAVAPAVAPRAAISSAVAPAVAPRAAISSAAAAGTHAVRLLDVSTNQDLLGVEIALPDDRVGFQLAKLDICAAARNVHVFTVPQVQWEPVRTLDRDQDIKLGHFPTPLASVTDGGATQLSTSDAVHLVPAVPDRAVNAVLDAFHAGESAQLSTTLAFGMRAFLTLRPRDSGGRKADTIARNQPVFHHPDLLGGAQLAFIAESGPSQRDESSYFDGSMIQLRNGVNLDSGASLDISVLGSVVDPADSVQEMFNNEFSTGKLAKVPVTRLDISGYGGSCFSDWLKKSAAYAEAAKVQFQILVGRTALEVVKFATVLYPWGVRLTRTVTIERRGGGGVIRRDSGWQASSPGLFQFPPSAVPGTSYVVHPGLLRGLFAVRNVRSTGLAPISFPGKNGKQVILAPKFFDANVRIDGLEGASELAAVGLLGFLQIEPIGEALHEDDLRALIAQQGPIGGPVDGVVQVGGSGFRVRATRIEVGSAIGTGGRPELIGAVRSAPVFRTEGAWSAVRVPGPANPHGDAEAVTANDVHGLPIVREGLLTGVSSDTMLIGPQTDYRFADEADVHAPGNPVWEYGFLQTSPAHVFLFPRPHVDPGVREIRTRSTPRFADIYARCTSKGLFPPAANAVTLPANVLTVDVASGGFSLRDAVNIPAPRPPLVLAQRGSDVMQVDYSGATLSLSIQRTAWSVGLPGVEIWTDILGVPKVAGLRSHLVAGTNARPVLQDIAMLLKSELETALTFLSGFSARPTMGPVDLGASNNVVEHKVTLGAERFWEFGEAPPQVKLSVGGQAEFGWSTDSAPPPGTTPGTTYDIGLVATAGVEGKIPIYGPVYLLLGAEIEIGGAVELKPGEPAELNFQFDLKAFIGVGVSVGIFDGSVAIGYHLAIDGGTVKNGIFAKIEAELDLKIVKVSVEGEIGGLWYDDTTHPPNTHASDLEGEVQANVEFLFISIHASYEYTETKYFN